MREGRSAARLSEFVRQHNLDESVEAELREIVQAAILEACLGSVWRMRRRRQRATAWPQQISG
jgi:hypothetical protein